MDGPEKYDAPATPSDVFAPKGRSLTRWVRTVMWGAIVIPATSFVLLSAWGYERAVDDARAKVLQASALSLRQAVRILEVAQKVAKLADEATSAPDDDVRANEAVVHQRFSDLCAGLGFVVNMNVWASDGSPLIRSDLYPVDRRASVANRSYFTDQQHGDGAVGIGEVLSGRQSGRELFNVTFRRSASRAPVQAQPAPPPQPQAAARSRFNGIVAVSLSPEAFRDYYRSLAADEPDLASFALVRTDGTILARWPAVTPSHMTVDPDNPIFVQVREGVSSGISVVPERDGRQSRLLSFRRVDGWPAYVTAGISNSRVVSGWLRFTLLLLAIFLPVTAGLVWVSWVALRKIREEQLAAEAMHREMQRRAQAEKQVVEGQKLQTLAQLTGGVAHDFNNLLTIVSNNLHILKKRHPDLSNDKHLSSVFRAVQSGVRLTRQLLSFSRKQALRPERVDLREWLKDTEDLIRSTLGSRTDLEYAIAPDTAPIRVDLGELELALINTALNAQHAMAGAGRLRISARNAVHRHRPMVVVGVEDSGEGIAPELIGKVFEPFFTTRTAGKGSGLGLSQVAGLCEQAGGFADLESVVGQGTTVRMHFPAESPDADTDAVVSIPAKHARRLDGPLLLVEDNAEVALVTEQLLRAAGIDVVHSRDAASALERVMSTADDIALVLTDISMPGPMDGIQLALAIRDHRASLPVILMTGYAEKIHEAVAEGFRVLAKPMKPDDLLDEIQAALDAHNGLSLAR